MSISHDIDVQVSGSTKHIFYFLSEDRDIISKAVNESAAIWGLLKPAQNVDKGKRLDWLRDKDRLLNFECRFTSLNRTPQRTLPGGKEQNPNPPLYILTDFHTYSERDRAIRIKAFLDFKVDGYLFVSSPFLLIPDGFDDAVELVQVNSVQEDDILDILGNGLTPSPSQIESMAQAFKGLNEPQIQKILQSVKSEFGENCAYEKYKSEMKDYIAQEKKRACQKDPAVEFLDYEETEECVGLDECVTWLKDWKDSARNPAEVFRQRGSRPPKGMLLTGVPGTGKTMMARQAARILGGLTLVQFRLELINSDRFGGSESNLRRYLKRIEALAPCVLLVDEVEKFFGVSDGTHEVKLAMLGMLLDWMQNRKSFVFTVITANKIDKVPPELLRDGRLSERFIVFMPTADGLAAMLTSKLATINEATGGKLLKDVCRKNSAGTFARDVMKRIGKEGEGRRPFFTGANLDKLIDEVNNALWREKAQAPYAPEQYGDMLVDFAVNRVVPQGRSNMADIVDLWLAAQDMGYKSAGSMSLPFDAFDKENARFDKTRMPACDNAYDRHLQEVFKEHIEKRQKKKNNDDDLKRQYLDDKAKSH